MITEDYVSFETAKLLKEKGFDEICFAVWRYWEDSIGKPCFINSLSMVDERGYPYCCNSRLKKSENDGEIDIACPTLQMAMKWLRETHNIHIEVNLSFSEDPIKYPPFYYVYVLDSKSGNSVIDQAARIDGLNPLVDVDNVPRNFNTYEEACEAAIRYCLENLI